LAEGVQLPTAVQLDGPTHDTEDNPALVPGNNVLQAETIRQEVPSQRSTNGPPGLLPLSQPPTAVQSDGPTHDTEDSDVPVAPLGLGDGTICQEVPFQRSASGWYAPLVVD
jgi:hypothetical protein